MSSVLHFLEVKYNTRIRTFDDYLKALKAASNDPIDVYYLLASIRILSGGSEIKFVPTFDMPISSKVDGRVVKISDRFFDYKYVVEGSAVPFVYLDEIRVKERPKVERACLETDDSPRVYAADNVMSFIYLKRKKTAYEDYIYALNWVNQGTLPFAYALPFHPSSRIDDVIMEGNVIKVYSVGEERDIILLKEASYSLFTFGVVDLVG